VRALRLIPALVLISLGVLVALLAADVRLWQQTLADGSVAARPRVPWSAAARVLAVDDDVQLRRAIALFRATASTRPRLDNALAITAARAHAETELATVASGRGARASQAGTLLGVLAFGDLARGGGRDASQAQTALGDFAEAVRADPTDEIAKFDLELLTRSLVAHGVRTGTTEGDAAGATGRTGAGSGVPGQGY
jgi:hypothetical protein